MLVQNDGIRPNYVDLCSKFDKCSHIPAPILPNREFILFFSLNLIAFVLTYYRVCCSNRAIFDFGSLRTLICVLFAIKTEDFNGMAPGVRGGPAQPPPCAGLCAAILR